MFRFKNNNSDDYIDKIIDLNKPEEPAIYDEHPPFFKDPFVKLAGGIWLALAIIAALVLLFAPFPSFFNGNFSRKMVLASVELSLFFILILVIWYHRSDEVF